MKTIIILTEGKTEGDFCEKIIYPVLGCDKIKLRAIPQGGFAPQGNVYKKIKTEVEITLKELPHEGGLVTTMFDLYGINRGFPGYDTASEIQDPYEKTALLEKGFKADIDSILSKNKGAYKEFLPYIQLHEFEALMFSCLKALAEVLSLEEKKKEELNRLMKDFGHNPELIDGGKDTAPSKRLRLFDPRYNKRLMGMEIAQKSDWIKSEKIVGILMNG